MRSVARTEGSLTRSSFPLVAHRNAVLAAAVLAAVAVGGTLLAQIPQIRHGDAMHRINVAGGALIVLAVALTTGLHRRPVWALLAASVVVDGYLLIGYPYGPVQLCVVGATYLVARRHTFSASLLVSALAAVVTSLAVYARLTRDVETPWLLAIAWTSWSIVPWSLGALAHAVIVSRERFRRDLLARGALEERIKIASEVHDVAGHGFALVAMQAGVALLTFDEKPEQTRRSLEAIKTTSAQSLAALRGMLDTVDHRDPAVPPDRVPVADGAPAHPERAGLAGLVELVEQVRAGGLPVRLEIGTLDRIPAAGADATAYRTVQEALTNVLRHAGPTTAEVSVTQRGDVLTIRVRDRGCGLGDRPAEGRGLSGMRRRIEAGGGELTAGPVEGGGFQVEAWLPMSRVGNWR